MKCRARSLGSAAFVAAAVLACAQPTMNIPDAGVAIPRTCTMPEPDYAAVFGRVLAAHPDFSGRIIVERCGHVIYDQATGMADRAHSTPVDKTTLFDLGSLAKSLTAASILALVDDGRLALDDTLGVFVSGLDHEKSAISLRQLLTHTSGIPESPWEDGEAVSNEEFLAWLRAAPLDFEPGTEWEYSNAGYSLLALIVEQRSGELLEHFWRSRFLDPAEIPDLGYRAPHGPLAANYLADGSATAAQRSGNWAPDGPYINLLGNGGLLGTPLAFLHWFDAVSSGQLLSDDSTGALFSAQVRTGKADEAYGFGWRIIEREPGLSIEHGGSNGASFYAALRNYRSADATLVFATNSFDPAAIRDVFAAFDDSCIVPACDLADGCHEIASGNADEFTRR